MTAPKEPYRKARKPRLGQQLPPLPVASTLIEGRAVSESFLERGRAMVAELQGIRRDIHQNPEAGLETPRTQRKVLEALEGLPLEIQLGQDLTSVVAVLRGGKRGDRPVSVLLRADMDALEVREQTSDPFTSINEYMHACGHDLHTAGLIGAARLLCEFRHELKGDIIFMFQPGEEGPGGAEMMIEEGVLDAAGRRPIAAYGLHVGPQDRGTFHHVAGPMMASSSNLTITVLGKGGHGSRPHDSADPVAALAEIQMAIQVALTRRFDAVEPIVITVTYLRAGDGANNAIPDKATLGGTVRVLRDEKIEAVRQMITEVATSVAASHRCTAHVEFEVLYAATKTHPRENQFAATLWSQMFGAENVLPLQAPMMASEDFGYVLAQVPGTFMWMGTANPATPPHLREWNHSPLARFDDSMLGEQAAALAAVAFERLSTEDEYPSAATKAMRAGTGAGSAAPGTTAPVA